MNKFNQSLTFSLIFSLAFSPLINCGGSAVKSNVQKEASLEDLIAEYESSDNKNPEVYQPVNKSRMDHVEYLINQDLVLHGLSGGSTRSGEDGFEPIYVGSGKLWRPDRSYSIPFTKNDKVDQWIDIFTGRLRPNFSRYLTRMSLYAPMIEDILSSYGLPKDLIYLAMIESGFNLHAYSRAHAAGPWQFIKSTGKLYGLRAEGLIDERRDVVKATHAAARHLKDLHDKYHDWYLAFAAYNAGSGSVNRAIRKGHSKDFWHLTHGKRRYFRNETKNYVPKILAAAHIVKNYKKYGFSDDLIQPPIKFEQVMVDDATDISVIAECAGVSEETIHYLNPSLLAGVSPIGEKYVVNLPYGRSKIFKRKYAKLEQQEKVRYTFHKVRSRETVSSIASGYGVDARALAQVNKLSVNSNIVSGAFLKIPGQSLATVKLLAKNGVGGVAEYHKVRSGDNLWKIAKKYKTSISKLRELNNLSKKAVLQIGQRLKVSDGIYVARSSSPATSSSNSNVRLVSSTHRVKRGDTLGKIARAYGVSIKSLQAWNHLGRNTNIKIGEVIKVSQPESAPVLASKTVVDRNDQTEILTYKVQSGDSLGKIANHHGISVQKLQAINNMGSKTTIRVGEELKIKEVAVSKVDHKPQAVTVTARTYKVQSGDFLGKIAQNHRVSVEDLKSHNHLKSNDIQVGQILNIPGSALVADNKSITVSEKSQKSSTYKVQSGDFLGKIAQAHEVSIEDLKSHNRLKSNNIWVGQVLKIPHGEISTSSSTQKALGVSTNSDSSLEQIYKVKSGDSLGKIANQHRISIASLKSYNDLKSDDIRIAQELKIPAGETTLVSKNDNTVIHAVRSGETLWDLSRKYGVTVAEIKKWNNLKNSSIRPEQEIKIIALR